MADACDRDPPTAARPSARRHPGQPASCRRTRRGCRSAPPRERGTAAPRLPRTSDPSALLLPARHLVPAIREALVHVVHVDGARRRRSYPAHHRPEQAPYHAAGRAGRRADPRVSSDGAAYRTARGAHYGARARVPGDLRAPALIRCRTCLVRQRGALRDVTVGSGSSDLLVLLIAVENRPGGGATDDSNHEKSDEPELHSPSMA